MIVTFANQKGGVGKTTLAILYANFLKEQGITPLLVDCDNQRSLIYTRSEDVKNFSSQDLPYEIIELDLSNAEQVQLFCQELKQSEDITILDAPGNLTEEGLLQVFVSSDFIVIPFQYERKCIDSTGVLISALEQITAHKKEKPLLLFSPNRIKSGEGLKSERELWAKLDESLSTYGVVLPPIKDLSCLKRVTTFITTKEQDIATRPCLESINRLVCQRNPSKKD